MKRRKEVSIRDTFGPPTATNKGIFTENENVVHYMKVFSFLVFVVCAVVVVLGKNHGQSLLAGSIPYTILMASPKTALNDVARSKGTHPQVEVLAMYQHDSEAFTQGLVVAKRNDQKFFVESTGLNGKSTVRKVNITTGNVLSKYHLDDDLFGEGITIGADGKLIMITWQNLQGLVLNLSPSEADDSDTITLERTFPFSTVTGEGWGIDFDGTSYVVSDGSSTLQWWDSATMKTTRQVSVTFNGQPVSYLNELEVANGYVYANVWFQYVIVKIDPSTGNIVSVFDCTELANKADASSNQNAVLNGIAYDGEEDVFYVTGKLWGTMTVMWNEGIIRTVSCAKDMPLETFQKVAKMAVLLFHPEDERSQKRLSRTASASGRSAEEIESIVNAIAKILMDAAKSDMPTVQLGSLLKSLDFPIEHVSVLQTLFDDHKQIIKSNSTRSTELNLPHYQSLEWRVDLEIANRMICNHPTPIVTLGLTTANPTKKSKPHTTCLRVDYPTLKKLQSQLECALSEVDSLHCSRMQRYLH